MKITWFGHASFMIESDGKRIYIDPYIIPDNAEKADFILISHEHYDHCDPKNVEKLSKAETKILTTEAAGKRLKGNVGVLKAGDTLSLNSIKVIAVEAYNPEKHFHPKGTGIGFIIEVENKRIYFCGDTDFIPEMYSLDNIDLALLAVGGTYTMNYEEAAKAVKAIKPKIAIPMHYGKIVGSVEDAIKFKELVEKETDTKVVILSEGESFEL